MGLRMDARLSISVVAAVFLAASAFPGISAGLEGGHPGVPDPAGGDPHRLSLARGSAHPPVPGRWDGGDSRRDTGQHAGREDGVGAVSTYLMAGERVGLLAVIWLVCCSGGVQLARD
jgi:hypothetical protein